MPRKARPLAVATWVNTPRSCSTPSANPVMSKYPCPRWTSTSRSRSIAAVASPRTTEPKTQTLCTPY